MRCICALALALVASSSLRAGPLYLVSLESEHLYLDRVGRVVLALPFAEASDFHEGFALVRPERGGPYGFIDEEGRLLPATFDYAHDFSEGLAAVSHEGKWGFIDKSGSVVVQPQFQAASSFSEGLAAVQTGAGWGFLDKAGRVVVAPRFESARDVAGGLAAVKLGGKWGVIDASGAFVVEPRFAYLGSFADGRAPASDDGRRFGFIDGRGRFAIAPTFEGAGAFSGRRAPVTLDGKVGYLDPSGAVVIAPAFDSGSAFSEGMAEVRVGGLRGFLDEAGAMKIAPQCASTEPFRDGRARCAPPGEDDDDGPVRLIDASGNVVFDAGAPAPSYQRSCDAGMAWACGRLAEHLALGAGVERDPLRARELAEKGCGLELGSACLVLAAFFVEGVGGSYEGARADELRGRLCDGGHLESCFVRGALKEQGLLVERDLAGAREQYQKACAAGAQAGCLGVHRVDVRMRDGALAAESPYRAAADYFLDVHPASALVPFRAQGKVGYADRSGVVVVEPSFEQGWGFAFGRAAVKVGDEWGFLDEGGVMAIAPRFAYADSFSEGLAAVSVVGRPFGSEPREPRGGADGWVEVSVGYIGTGGDVVIPHSYANGRRFSEGLAPVLRQGAGWAYIDKSGAVVIDAAADDAQPFSEGLAAVKTSKGLNGLWGYLDKGGKLVLEARYVSAGPFRGGHAVVAVGSWSARRYGVIDRAGNVVVPFEHRYLGALAEDRIAFSDDEQGVERRFGFLDGGGRVVIAPKLQYVGRFSGGFAPACEGATGVMTCGYLDREGRWVIEPRREVYPREYSGDVALVLLSDPAFSAFNLDMVPSIEDWALIDRGGQPLPFRPAGSPPLSGPASVEVAAADETVAADDDDDAPSYDDDPIVSYDDGPSFFDRGRPSWPPRGDVVGGAAPRQLVALDAAFGADSNPWHTNSDISTSSQVAGASIEPAFVVRLGAGADVDTTVLDVVPIVAGLEADYRLLADLSRLIDPTSPDPGLALFTLDSSAWLGAGVDLGFVDVRVKDRGYYDFLPGLVVEDAGGNRVTVHPGIPARLGERLENALDVDGEAALGPLSIAAGYTFGAGRWQLGLDNTAIDWNPLSRWLSPALTALRHEGRARVGLGGLDFLADLADVIVDTEEGGAFLEGRAAQLTSSSAAGSFPHAMAEALLGVAAGEEHLRLWLAAGYASLLEDVPLAQPWDGVVGSAGVLLSASEALSFGGQLSRRLDVNPAYLRVIKSSGALAGRFSVAESVFTGVRVAAGVYEIGPELHASTTTKSAGGRLDGFLELRSRAGFGFPGGTSYVGLDVDLTGSSARTLATDDAFGETRVMLVVGVALDDEGMMDAQLGGELPSLF